MTTSVSLVVLVLFSGWTAATALTRAKSHGLALIAVFPVTMFIAFNFIFRPLRLLVEDDPEIGTIATARSSLETLGPAGSAGLIAASFGIVIVGVALNVGHAATTNTVKSAWQRAERKLAEPTSLAWVSFYALAALTIVAFAITLRPYDLGTISRARREVFLGKGYVLLLADCYRFMLLGLAYADARRPRRAQFPLPLIAGFLLLIGLDLVSGSRTRLMMLTILPIMYLGYLRKSRRPGAKPNKRARALRIGLSSILLISLFVGLRAGLRDGAENDDLTAGETTASDVIAEPGVVPLMSFLTSGREVSGVDYFILLEAHGGTSHACAQPFSDIVANAIAFVPRGLKPACYQDRASYSASDSIINASLRTGESSIAVGGPASAGAMGGWPYLGLVSAVIGLGIAALIRLGEYATHPRVSPFVFPLVIVGSIALFDSLRSDLFSMGIFAARLLCFAVLAKLATTRLSHLGPI